MFYYLLNAVMISRLIYGFGDEPVSLKKISVAALIQIVLFLAIGPLLQFVLLSIFSLILNAAVYFSESRASNLNFARIGSLAAFIVLAAIFASSSSGSEFNSYFPALIDKTSSYIFLPAVIKRIDPLKLQIVLTGILLLVNESNFAVRFIFEIFNLAPKKDEGSGEAIDLNEYNAGRIIGALERILIFFFMMSGELGAIGFIIAAKGFTRFRELDNRSFAEYVLIGTFLSSLAAVIVALAVKAAFKI